MQDPRLRESDMTSCVTAHKFGMGLSPGNSFAESTGEDGKRLNTKYQGYCVYFLFFDLKYILRSSNQTEFQQLLKKLTYGNADVQESLKHSVAVLYVRMRKAVTMEKNSGSGKSISAIVNFHFSKF